MTQSNKMHRLGWLALAGLVSLCVTTAAWAITSAPALAVSYTNACGTTAFCTAVPGSEPDGVAVDNSTQSTAGDVYLVYHEQGKLAQYSAAGAKLSEISVPSCSSALRFPRVSRPRRCIEPAFPVRGTPDTRRPRWTASSYRQPRHQVRILALRCRMRLFRTRSCS